MTLTRLCGVGPCMRGAERQMEAVRTAAAGPPHGNSRRQRHRSLLRDRRRRRAVTASAAGRLSAEASWSAGSAPIAAAVSSARSWAGSAWRIGSRYKSRSRALRLGHRRQIVARPAPSGRARDAVLPACQPVAQIRRRARPRSTAPARGDAALMRVGVPALDLGAGDRCCLRPPRRGSCAACGTRRNGRAPRRDRRRDSISRFATGRPGTRPSSKIQHLPAGDRACGY